MGVNLKLPIVKEYKLEKKENNFFIKMKVLLYVMVVLLSAYQVLSLSCYQGATKDAAAKKACLTTGGFDRCMNVSTTTTTGTTTIYSCSTKALVETAKAEDKCVTTSIAGSSATSCGCKADDCNYGDVTSATTAKPTESAAATQSAIQIFSMTSILL